MPKIIKKFLVGWLLQEITHRHNCEIKALKERHNFTLEVFRDRIVKLERLVNEHKTKA